LVPPPCTVAENCTALLVLMEAALGFTTTEITEGFAAGAAVTVTVAEADLVGSAMLVAVIVAEPAAAGAV
jgi:positive regulator of sigma E activity